ncbi:MAG: hypothetical protein AAF493_27700 [Pseudomonadota bacterium]
MARTKSWPLVASLALMAAVSAKTADANTLALSTFDTDEDMWVGLACPNPGLCVGPEVLLPNPGKFRHVATGGPGGVGDGFIQGEDPDSGNVAQLKAPPKFITALPNADTLSFDVLVEDPDGTGAFENDPTPAIAITGGGSTIVYGAQNPAIGVWTHFDVALAPGPGWVVVTSGGFAPADASDFATVMGAVSQLTFIGEWLNDDADIDTGGLDNVRLSAVPVPAALPLLLSAFGLLAIVRRRRAA